MIAGSRVRFRREGVRGTEGRQRTLAVLLFPGNNALQSVVLTVTQLCGHTENPWKGHFKWANCVKGTKRKEEKSSFWGSNCLESWKIEHNRFNKWMKMHMVLKGFLCVDSKQCLGVVTLRKKTVAVGFKCLEAVCNHDSEDLESTGQVLSSG